MKAFVLFCAVVGCSMFAMPSQADAGCVVRRPVVNTVRFFKNKKPVRTVAKNVGVKVKNVGVKVKNVAKAAKKVVFRKVVFRGCGCR